MTFEEASDMMDLYNIDPSLTCTCDEVHICQQCMHDIDDIDYGDKLKKALSIISKEDDIQ